MRRVTAVRWSIGGCIVVLWLLALGVRSPGSKAEDTSASTSASIETADLHSARVPFGAFPTKRLAAAKVVALDKVLDGIVASGAPDAIAAVVTSKGTWAGAAGVDGPHKRLATPRDQFAIASVTKTFTAAAVMRLVEKGKMRLDAPLGSYLGDLARLANKATVRQALAMRAGLPDTSDAVIDAVYRQPTRIWETNAIVSKFDEPLGAAGTFYEYSNPTYKLLGFAIERTVGKPLATVMRETLLTPVGVTRIIAQGALQRTPKPWALPLAAYRGGYDASMFGQGNALPTLADATFSAGASSLASDAPSLAAWAWHLFNGDLIKPASLAAMMKLDGSGNGLGLDQVTFTPESYGHSGSKPGYATLFAVFPAERAVVVVFVNDADAELDGDVLKLLSAATT
jgi:D-alanyl-D-alanine carboxypeptidase